MRIVQIISTAILWILIGVYIYLIRREVRLRKQLRDSILQLQEAKKRCDDTAQKLDAVLDALQRDGVNAALAMFEKEETAE